MAASETWDLDALVPGGVRGHGFRERIETCRRRVDALLADVARLPPVAGAADDALLGWRRAMVEAFDVYEDVQVVDMLAACALAADTTDAEARAAAGVAGDLAAGSRRALDAVGRALRGATDGDVARLAGDLDDYVPWLISARDGQSLGLAPPLQDLLDDADRELVVGWCDLARRTVDALGVGPLVAKDGDPDAAVRRDALVTRETSYREAADVVATSITHLVRTRQMREDRAGIDELARSLHDNRVDRETLEAMWEGASTAKPALVAYLRAKARALGQDALPWWDLAAPVGEDVRLTWGEARERIVGAFAAAEPDLAASARRLLDEGAVDVAIRPGKRAGGGTCFPFGRLRTSRILSTFTGTLRTASLVAHELGHGWHADVLYGEPMVRRWITPALAETASMYAEAIVRESAGGDGDVDDAGRRYALDQQLQLGVLLVLAQRARHDFELQCYRLRREGPLAAALLADEMVACQREAIGDALSRWHPWLWVEKPHFTHPRTAFQSWPYTFGYLLGLAVRARGAPLRGVLVRTGWQPTRELVRDVLGEDVRDPAFWAAAVRPLIDAAAAFEAEAPADVG